MLFSSVARTEKTCMRSSLESGFAAGIGRAVHATAHAVVHAAVSTHRAGRARDDDETLVVAQWRPA